MKTVKLTDYELFLLNNALQYYENFLNKSQSNTTTLNSVEKLQDKIKGITKSNSRIVVCDI
jgi:hypothetical protein